VVVVRQSRRVLITKGALEGIFPLLSGYELESKAEPISKDAAKRIQQISDELNTRGSARWRWPTSKSLRARTIPLRTSAI